MRLLAARTPCSGLQSLLPLTPSIAQHSSQGLLSRRVCSEQRSWSSFCDDWAMAESAFPLRKSLQLLVFHMPYPGLGVPTAGCVSASAPPAPPMLVWCTSVC